MSIKEPHNAGRSDSRILYGAGMSWSLILPWLGLLVVGFAYPVFKLLSGSFFDDGFTLVHYQRAVTEPLYTAVLLRTLRIALIVTVCALLVGYPIAYAISKLVRPWSMVVAACVLIPFWTSILVRSYAWIVLLQRKGLINTLLIDLGVTSEPLRLLYTEFAVILAMTHVLLPFLILPVYGALKTIPADLPMAAYNLGATPIKVFWKVVFPLSLPGVFAGCLITFILALGFYITPALVGGPNSLMMATLIGQQTTQVLNWPFAGALATILLITTVVLAVMFRTLLAKNRGFSSGI
ncbi:ABC transporter permease [Hoeflea poritis]|uniref:ABC transporter permease n=1 Tax=Hoeflea poritis TaxID=2993659 RepID=A0ABT4VT01_9HYPH|nr:ABC transporter permease [Hoeflea poritis]MDA4847835.1 ABC transporter permease [Hoeflea poritis]